MDRQQIRVQQRRTGKGWLAILNAFCLLLVMAMNARAASVQISDHVDILDDAAIQNEATTLSYPLTIYTMNDFNQPQARFNEAAQHMLTSNNSIVIAIDSNMKQVAIAGGKDVHLTQEDYHKASTAFTESLTENGSYTNATIAAIRTLNAASTGGGGFNTVWCFAGLIVLAGIAASTFFIQRNRSEKNESPGETETTGEERLVDTSEQRRDEEPTREIDPDATSSNLVGSEQALKEAAAAEIPVQEEEEEVKESGHDIDRKIEHDDSTESTLPHAGQTDGSKAGEG